MVTRHDGKDLFCDRFKQFRALPQLFHRLKTCPVYVPDAGLDRRIHQIAVQNREDIVVVFDETDVFLKLQIVAVCVAQMQIRKRKDFYFLIVAKIMFDNFYIASPLEDHASRFGWRNAE